MLIKLLAMDCIYHHEGVRLLRHKVRGVISTAEDEDARGGSATCSSSMLLVMATVIIIYCLMRAALYELYTCRSKGECDLKDGLVTFFL